VSSKLLLNTERLLDQLHVDVIAKSHAVLEGSLVVRLCSFGLNVLLNGIDLRLVSNQLLLNVVKSVVDITLQYLVLLRVMLH
jgi:hypothetical protein